MNFGQQLVKQVPDDDFLVIGPAFKVLQLNVEGVSAAKWELIGVLTKEVLVDVICLQETYIVLNEARQFKIIGFNLLSLHVKHSQATYIHRDILAAVHIESSPFCNTVEVGGFQIANIYKPLSETWGPQVLPRLKHPAVYVGDFDSHHSKWGYLTAPKW